MPIVIIPRPLVLIMRIIRDQLLKRVPQIVLHQSRLKFHGRDCSGRADDKEVDQAGDSVFGQALLQLWRDINDVVIPFGGEFEGESLHAMGCSRFVM